MLKAVKIRLYPNKTQQSYINQLLGCYRLVYNKCLDKKKTAYTTDKTNLDLKSMGNYFHQELTKDSNYSFLTEHNTKVLKQSILNMLESYKRFFINGSGFPKFKSKHDNKQSCRFPEEAISSLNDYESGKLMLTKQLKDLHFRCSDKYKSYLNKHKTNIRSATLTRTKSGKKKNFYSLVRLYKIFLTVFYNSGVVFQVHNNHHYNFHFRIFVLYL